MRFEIIVWIIESLHKELPAALAAFDLLFLVLALKSVLVRDSYAHVSILPHANFIS